MIEQGCDGLSRGNLLDVQAGKEILYFIPIAQSTHQRSPKLLQWIRNWTKCRDLTPLTPKDWLWKGQGLHEEHYINTDGFHMPKQSSDKILLWMPTPCIADIAIEFLRKSHHKRPHLCHIIVIPKLMTYNWRKQLLKSCDLSFYVDVGETHWSPDQHEYLFVALFLPQLHCPPWSFRRTKYILELERKLRKVQSTKEST